MKDERITAVQFLNDLFVRDMEHALNSGLHYYVFPLLCQGIEVMGSFFDACPIDERGKSQSRFVAAIDLLFTDPRYRSHKKSLYEGLRSNMVHQMRPGAPYALASSTHEQADRGRHLQRIANGPVVLVLEVLLADFRDALRQLNRFIAQGDPRLDKTKVNEPFLFYGRVSRVR